MFTSARKGIQYMAAFFHERHRLHPRALAAMAMLVIVSASCLLVWLGSYVDRGYDFTDEGYYLNAIAHPSLYQSTASQFGAAYHPLYEVLGGSVAALRLANVIITWALAAWVFWLLIGRTSTAAISVIRLASAMGLSSASLVAFQWWLITPSYNSLNLQTILICLAGLLLTKREVDWRSVAGWLVLGVGGGLLFLSKPTSALAMAISALLLIVLDRRWSIRGLLLTVAAALGTLGLAALVLDGSPIRFVERLRHSYLLSQTLFVNSPPILRLGPFPDLTSFGIRVAGITLVLAGLVFAISSLKRWLRFIAEAGIFVLFLYFNYILNRPERLELGYGPYQSLLYLACIPLGLLLFLWLLPKSDWHRYLAWPTLGALVIFLLPYVYIFGSNNNYWMSGSAACVFWVVGLVWLLVPVLKGDRGQLTLLVLAFATVLGTASMFLYGVERPYRQTDRLEDNRTPVALGEGRGKHYLTPPVAAYVTEARTLAEQAGFTIGTPVLDFSGQSPGLIFAIGGAAVGQGWLIGGYPGSEAYVQESLRLVQADLLARSWLIVEPSGPRSVSPQMLDVFGLPFPANYTLVGTLKTFSGAGGYAEPRVQYLYKPKG